MKKITFQDVGGLAKIKREIKTSIIYPIERPDLYELYKKGIKSSILLYGPPGCGKTHIARATAGEVKANFYNIKITDVLSKWYGETDRNIRRVFDEARKNAPSVLFFDEIDGIAAHKSGEYHEVRVLNALLAELDGFEDRGDVMVLAATNSPWNIDPALMRPGRFDKLLFVPPPDFDARIEIFRIHLRGRPLSSDVDFEELARRTKGASGADIREICDEAASIPLEEAMEGKEPREICMADFLKVMEKRKFSLIYWFKIASVRIREKKMEEFFSDLLEYLDRMEEEERSDREVYGYI